MKRSSDNSRKLLAVLIVGIAGAALVKTLSRSDGQRPEAPKSERCLSVDDTSSIYHNVTSQNDEMYTSIQKNLEVSLVDKEEERLSFAMNDRYVDTPFVDVVVQSDIQSEQPCIDVLTQIMQDDVHLQAQNSIEQEQETIQIADNSSFSSRFDEESQQAVIEKNQEEIIDVYEQQDLIREPAYSAQSHKTVKTSLRYPTKVTPYSSSIATCFPHFIFQATAFFAIADKSFDNCHKKSTLSHLVFNQDVTFKDILLISSLSAQNKVRVDNVPARVPDRQDAPIGPNPGGVPWGGYSSDQYIRLLADTQVRINGEQKEAGISFSGTYRFTLDCFEYATFAVGLTLPFKSQEHTMDFRFVGGSLFTEEIPADRTQRRDSTKDFFRTYIDITDFFYRAILDPKGLTFSERIRKSGIGDISLFGFADWAPCISFMDSLQTGVNLVLPSGGKQNSSVVWDPVLGNGGAFACNFFVNGLFNTCWNWLNPNIIISAEISAPMTNCQRVPGIVQSSAEVSANGTRQKVNTVPGLFAPPPFETFYVDSFTQFSASVPYFADSAVSTRTRYGSKVIVGLGNYAYHFFRPEFRFGFLYEYMYKAKDHVSAKECGTFDTSVLTKNTKSQAHIISWNIAYASKKGLEVNIGGRYIIAGQNIPKQSEAFINMVVFF